MNLNEKKEQYNFQIDSIADKILQQMIEGAEKWEMPWHKGLPEAWNPVTGKYYGGNNLLILWDECLRENYSHNYWATFKQWQKIGAKVRKGQKGTLILHAIPRVAFAKQMKKQQKQLNLEFINEKERKDATPNFYFRYSWVFNESQVDDYNVNHPDLFTNPTSDIERLQSFVHKTKANIKSGGERAYYNISKDFIQMPELARFKNGQGAFSPKQKYYSTLLHEIIHWTGHPSRCRRRFGRKFGDPVYAFEELVAEFGGGILVTQFNTLLVPRKDHANYLNGWLSVLENDFSYFIEALELARTAIYWLYKKTNILQFDLKP